jgi:hypothetical protein
MCVLASVFAFGHPSAEDERLPHDVLEPGGAGHDALLDEAVVLHRQYGEHQLKPQSRLPIGVRERSDDKIHEFGKGSVLEFVPPTRTDRPCRVAVRQPPVLPQTVAGHALADRQHRGCPAAQRKGHPDVERSEERPGVRGGEGGSSDAAKLHDVRHYIDI